MSDAARGEDADELMVLVPIPPLLAILLSRERAKSAPLTEAEVLAIRDGAVCMTMPVSIALKVADKRGYDDIRPDYAWADWSAIRLTLNTGPEAQQGSEP